MFELIKAYKYFIFLRNTRNLKTYPNPLNTEEYVTRKQYNKIIEKVQDTCLFQENFGSDED